MDNIRKYLPGGIDKYVEGIEFPIGKEDAIGKLQENGAPNMVINQLQQRLPEGEYNSPQEVLSALKGGQSGDSGSS